MHLGRATALLPITAAIIGTVGTVGTVGLGTVGLGTVGLSGCGKKANQPATPPALPPSKATVPVVAAPAAAAPVPTPIEPAPVAAAPAAPTAPAGKQGERAPFEIVGDVVHVNNTLCGVSRTPMGPETLGKFVSRVDYSGDDPRFKGKSLEFNQCCAMCLEKFPQLYAQDPAAVMAFHGLE